MVYHRFQLDQSAFGFAAAIKAQFLLGRLLLVIGPQISTFLDLQDHRISLRRTLQGLAMTLVLLIVQYRNC